MAITTCVFDAYGTLFDVSAAARHAATEPGHEALAEHWAQLAELWRAKQLEYTWLRAIAGAHKDFWHVTQDALDWALEAIDLPDPALRDRLLALYRELSTYPEVPDVLAALNAAGTRAAILSNGAPEMLDAAVSSAGIGEALAAVLSVEEVGVFKPHAKVYDLVGERLGVAREEVLFVSSNGWDACAAAAYGFRTAWANRGGTPVDRLMGRPDNIVADLRGIPALAGAA
ncbi:MAG: haloacid dehalogenase type II [Pseudomonadota bacterium]